MSSDHHQHHLPKFFKVYITHHSYRKMKIPIQFRENLETRNGGVARLTGSNGETWEVELVKDGAEMFFNNGWKVFVKENMIRENDFLFFTYHGKLRFSVRIFENATKCEKILPLSVRGDYNQGRSEKEVGTGRKRSKRSSDRGVSQTAEKHGQQLEVTLSVIKPSLVVKMTMHNVGRCPMFVSFVFFTSLLRIDYRTLTFMDLGAKFWLINRNELLKCQIFAKRLLKLTLQRIPVSFCRENSMCYERNEKMIIRVKESSWILNIIQNQNAYIFSAGWSAFVHDNNIGEGDIWVFELVDRLEMVARVSSCGR